jgi:alpha-tubulin suppressor-like RCC1 family protein
VSNFVERWGSLADIPGVTFQKLLSPTPARLPGQVAQVATSNSTYYALLTNGSVYAFGMGNKGQLGNGRSRTPRTRRCTCASRPG